MGLYPFPLAEPLRERLPNAARDGNYYVDVFARNVWDGVLVVNAESQVIGVLYEGRIQDLPLPFEPADIIDVRRACGWNRFLAALPGGPYTWALAGLFVLGPLGLLLGWLVWLPCTFVTLAVCIFALVILVPDRAFITFPMILLALSEMLGCGFLYVRILRQYAEALAGK